MNVFLLLRRHSFSNVSDKHKEFLIARLLDGGLNLQLLLNTPYSFKTSR